MIAAAARRGVRIAYVAETHLHNDYVSGGLELARVTGARYLVPAGASVSFARTPVADGDTVTVDRGLTLRALATPGHTPHHTSYVLEEDGRGVAAFTGGSLLIGTVGRPDLVEPRLTEQLARAQYASAHRLAEELDDEVPVLPTHGFGSFCSGSQAEGDTSTIGRERKINEALTRDVDAFVADLLAGLDDVPAYYAHMGPANAAGPAPVDLTPPRPADAAQIAQRLAAGEWVVDLRNRVAFAQGHVAGSFNFEGDGKPATYLAWLIPWGKPVTLLADTPERIAAAQRELARVGIDRPVAAAIGGPWDWVPGERSRGPSHVRPSPTSPPAAVAARTWSCWTCGATPSAWAAPWRVRCTSPSMNCPVVSGRCPRGGVGALRGRDARGDRRLLPGRHGTRRGRRGRQLRRRRRGRTDPHQVQHGLTLTWSSTGCLLPGPARADFHPVRHGSTRTRARADCCTSVSPSRNPRPRRNTRSE